jgi:hypothetical protein
LEEAAIMTRRLALSLIALALALSAAARAQGKPDFSGTWKFATSEPSGYKGSNGWGVPSTLVIRQGANELAIESEQYGAPMKVVYKLDGSDTIWDAPGASQSGSGTIVKWRTKARWDGNKLILFTWNTALNQMRDILTLNGGALNIVRATEQPGPSTNATLNYSKGS